MFKNINVKRLDSVLTELQSLILDCKYLALQLEMFLPDNQSAHFQAIETGRSVAQLIKSCQDLSIKYIDYAPDFWDKLAIYSPYYAALEPRSPFRLYEIAFQHKSRSNAILLRLEAILREGSVHIPMEVDEVRKNFSKLEAKLYNEKFEL